MSQVMSLISFNTCSCLFQSIRYPGFRSGVWWLVIGDPQLWKE